MLHCIFLESILICDTCSWEIWASVGKALRRLLCVTPVFRVWCLWLGFGVWVWGLGARVFGAESTHDPTKHEPRKRSADPNREPTAPPPQIVIMQPTG